MRPNRDEEEKGRRQSNRHSRNESLRPHEADTLAQRSSSQPHSAPQSQCSVEPSRYAASLEHHHIRQPFHIGSVNHFGCKFTSPPSPFSSPSLEGEEARWDGQVPGSSGAS
jgi:hypothetical protein